MEKIISYDPARIAEAEMLVAAIPTDVKTTDLVELLAPVFKTLSGLSIDLQRLFINRHVRTRFQLTVDETRSIFKIELDLQNDGRGQSVVPYTKSQREYKFRAHFPGLVDIVDNNGQTVFLIKNGESLEIRDHVVVNGELLLPPPRENLPFLLPRYEAIQDHFSRYAEGGESSANLVLYEDLKKHFLISAELPPDANILFAAWALHTYFMEWWDHSPFIHFYGPPDRGKSHIGKTMIYTAFRGVHVESLNPAHLGRLTHDVHASVFIDVKDLMGKARSQGSIDLILLRCERGAVLPSVTRPGSGPFLDTEYRSGFGPTIIATNEPLDGLMDSRAIGIQMLPSHRTFEPPRPEDALTFNEQSDACRAWYFDKPRPQVEQTYRGRFGDLTRPLFTIIQHVYPCDERKLKEFLAQEYEERASKSSLTIEAQIVRAIVMSKYRVRNGKLAVSVITDFLNENREGYNRISAETVGRELSGLGFRKTRMNNGAAGIVWDHYTVGKQASAYEIPSDPSDLSSDSND